ncbi:MAG: GNAT family N-acetyltransferase [Spirochaetales bacterium]|nr:GNAT family N-acetyltransferase [Spirochaetales bacterium]
MNISTMTIDDYHDAFALWNTTAGMGLRSLDDSKQGIEAFLKRNPETSFVCRSSEGELWGVILCGHDGRRGYIYHAAVKESCRNRGIGRSLVDTVKEALEKEGIKKAALVVYADNESGNAFWESLGFTLREDLHYRNLSLDQNNV